MNIDPFAIGPKPDDPFAIGPKPDDPFKFGARRGLALGIIALVALVMVAGLNSVLSGPAPSASPGASQPAATVSALGASASAITFAITVATSPASGGAVIATGDTVINCGSTGAVCAAMVAAGATVELVAAPAPGWVVGTWAGCSSVAGPNCTVVMTDARAVAVVFSPVLTPAPTALPTPVVTPAVTPTPNATPTRAPTAHPTVVPTAAPTADQAGPVIASLGWTPDVVGIAFSVPACTVNTVPPTATVTVTAIVTDPSGVGSVALLYQRGGDAAPISGAMTHGSGNTWSLTLDTAAGPGWSPPNQQSYVIQLGVRAIDGVGNASVTALGPAFAVEVCY